MIGGMCSFLRLEEMWRVLRFWRFFPDVYVGLSEAGRKLERSERPYGPHSSEAGGTPGTERFFKDSIHPHVDQYRKSP